jgi:aminoglycoside phosphotransferase (APT) family kinase protein
MDAGAMDTGVMDTMDQTLPFELNAETLPAYLAARGLLPDPGKARARLLTGGVSNQAFWVDGPGGPCVVKQARPRLAVAMEWRADVNRVIREAEALDWLHARIGPPRIPRLLHLDRQAKVLVMEAIAPPAENYKTRLLRGEVEPALAEGFGALLAEIHNATADQATRARFEDATYFDQLRLSPYYGTVAERHPLLAGRLALLRRECLEARTCLVHGDYSPKNILVREGTLVLLDYEVAHWGNPSFDLGFALTHYLCKALHLPALGAAFVEAARLFWRSYQALCRLPPPSRANAGHHLAAIMLARMDGKSPLEYFTDEGRRDTVRRIARAALLAERAGIDGLIAAVAAAAAAAGASPCLRAEPRP